MDFETFGFSPKVAAGVVAEGYVTPTPIQAEAISPVMAGKDVMGLAQTGTGKTAAFALPILNRLMTGKRGQVRALVVAPTRELAEQTHEAFQALGRKTGIRSASIYGGVSIHAQKQKLKRGVEILIACPGRLLDHLGQGTADLSHLEVLVLDEADQMFDMGFFPDIRRIIRQVPKKRQTLLFSATMPTEIRHLAREVLHDPINVQVGLTRPAETVRHALYPVSAHLKTPLLMELLRGTDARSVLVFTRTKHRAKRLGRQLESAGYRAASIQGNLSQSKRQAALNGFKDGTYQVLVATDIAARGIDVARVSHVINYDVPTTPEAYIHRIGRTGRATHTGDAFTLITEDDHRIVSAIDRVLDEPAERRTLDDFDYAVPAPPSRSGGPFRPNRSGGRPSSGGRRTYTPSRAPRLQAKRRDLNGRAMT
jgi:ATP-dependent RNA helicase RhlE